MFGEISKKDKLIIYLRTAIKILRGGVRRIFLKQAKGLFLVGRGLIFGDYVTISRGVMIRPSSYYGNDLGKGLVMGEHSSIGPYGYIGCSGKITIGKNVMFGPKCSLFAENHNFSDTESSIKSQGVNQKGITIEDDCWIGSNVIILDGVTIGKGSVIGAGTMVTKDVPAGSVVVDKREKKYRER